MTCVVCILFPPQNAPILFLSSAQNQLQSVAVCSHHTDWRGWWRSVGPGNALLCRDGNAAGFLAGGRERLSKTKDDCSLAGKLAGLAYKSRLIKTEAGRMNERPELLLFYADSLQGSCTEAGAACFQLSCQIFISKCCFLSLSLLGTLPHSLKLP